MPQTTPELAWWVMTGAIAGLLSLLTLLVGAIAYFMKSGFERILQRLDAHQTRLETQQVQGSVTEKQLAEHMADHSAHCRALHDSLKLELSQKGA